MVSDEKDDRQTVEDAFTELMKFHKGRYLGGLSLKELVNEGRISKGCGQGDLRMASRKKKEYSRERG